ncbi:MAG: amidohydrolase family protein [Ruminococcus sp.]|nr:amidohydrolase family protein [Ruminococcus sp.]
MKYFDFHTHAFTDSLAERALSALADTSGKIPETDGTLNGLKKTMQKNNIDEFMILPVATKPSQQTAINNWACGITGGGVYACGTVHPDSENALEETERIQKLGLCGVKFHSEYQGFLPNEERMFPIYQKISDCGLIAVFHGGYDPFGSPDNIRCTPRRMAEIIGKFPSLTFVLAHLGGIYVWDDTEKYLAGKFDNLYLDISVIASFDIDKKQLFRIIEKHGADKILFGSDCPWDNPSAEIDLINRLDISESDKEKIFYRNAHRLLNIKDI